MRRLFLFVFIFLGVRGISQNTFPQDKAIINLYSDTVKTIRLNDTYREQIADSNHYAYLVKIRTAYAEVFKKRFKALIRRQINENWFIIRAEPFSIEDNGVIEEHFSANNSWKLSPPLLNNLKQLPPDKNFIF